MLPVVSVNTTLPVPTFTAPLKLVPCELVMVNVLLVPVTVVPVIVLPVPVASPLFNVKLKLPVTAPKVIAAPPATPPLFVVSIVVAAANVIGAALTLKLPPAVKYVPFKVTTGDVPKPVYD